MTFELKFDELFSVGAALEPLEDAGPKPLENETEAFDTFETQAQARTSASAENYDPMELVSSGLRVLRESSRDLKVFTILVDVALSPPLGLAGPESLSLVLALGRALGPYWSRMHPLIDGRKGVRARQLLLHEVFHSLDKHLAATPPDSEFSIQISDALAAISHDLEAKGEDWSDTAVQARQVASRLKQPDPVPPKMDQSSQRPETSIKPPHIKTTKFNSRELRNRLLDLLGDLGHVSHASQDCDDLESPLAFALRRKAAFLPFEGEIAATKGRTELKDIPEERVQEVRATLETPTVEDLIALEQTLLARPLWITGHRYAYNMAQKLGGTAQALSIWSATRHEVERFNPALLTFTFVDGLNFSDAQTTEWLHEIYASEGSVSQVSVPKKAADQNAQGADQDETAKGGNDSQKGQDVLALLEADLGKSPESSKSSKSPNAQQTSRQNLLDLLAISRALSARAHPKMASAVARTALDSLELRNLTDWERDLAKSLGDLV